MSDIWCRIRAVVDMEWSDRVQHRHCNDMSIQAVVANM